MRISRVEGKRVDQIYSSRGCWVNRSFISGATNLRKEVGVGGFGKELLELFHTSIFKLCSGHLSTPIPVQYSKGDVL